MTYGKENIGSIIFLGNGRIKGVMQWMDKFEFIGKEVVEQQVESWALNVSNWKKEWRGINGVSYLMGSAARWGAGGGWYRGDEGDETSNSDTDSNDSEVSGEESGEDEDD